MIQHFTQLTLFRFYLYLRKFRDTVTISSKSFMRLSYFVDRITVFKHEYNSIHCLREINSLHFIFLR